jgi:hypothetical protein
MAGQEAALGQPGLRSSPAAARAVMEVDGPAQQRRITRPHQKMTSVTSRHGSCDFD